MSGGGWGRGGRGEVDGGVTVFFGIDDVDATGLVGQLDEFLVLTLSLGGSRSRSRSRGGGGRWFGWLLVQLLEGIGKGVAQPVQVILGHAGVVNLLLCLLLLLISCRLDKQSETMRATGGMSGGDDATTGQNLLQGLMCACHGVGML